MDIHQLRVFIAVFKNRSFSKASQELYLTQPTISEHIKGLEEELKVKLFDRVGRSVIPTRDAEILFEEALEIVDKVEKLRESLDQIRKAPSGNIIVGASSIPGTYILPKIIPEFRKEYPEVSLNISISDSKNVINDLLNGQILIGIVGTKFFSNPIELIPFMNDDLVLADSNFIKKDEIIPENLYDYPFILREEGSGTRKEMERWLNQMKIKIEKLKAVCTLSSTDAVKEAIKNGIGVSILSLHSIKDELESKKIRTVRISGWEMRRTFYLTIHKKRTLPFIYQLFLDFLKNKAFTI